jgi:hypothetical protein
MANTAEVWINGQEAIKILDIPDVRALERLVSEGLIGVRRLAGVRARYRREDCEALARLNAQPAHLATPGEPR